MLNVRVLPDHEAASRYAADRLVDHIRRHPSALLCLAAGATPMRTYGLLAEQAAAQPGLVDRVRLLKLDEWGGLPMDDPATCEHHLRTALVDSLNLTDRYVAFGSCPPDPEAECARIATWLADNGPIDTCVLGLGVNGHIGFNEPAAFLRPHAHVARLSTASLAHATLSLTDAQPSYGLTLGMADVMQSRQILLIVTGEAKRAPLERLLSGPITTEFPASLLQFHPEVHLLCDSSAYSAANPP